MLDIAVLGAGRIGRIHAGSIAAMRGETAMQQNGEDGLRALLLADAAEQSRRAGRTVSPQVA